MKIRWTKDSVRFRITPSELETLKNQNAVVERIAWGNGAWEVNINVGKKTTFGFENMTLQVSISPQDVGNLAEPENEGVYFSTGGENPIRYFIEKDFPCVHPRASEVAETPTETFEPPHGFEERKNQ